MSYKFRRIERKRGRKPLRETRPRFVLFCEGASTERTYFDAFRKEFRGNIPRIKFPSSESDPKTIYDKIERYIKGLHNSFEENDQIWAVFDCDDGDNYEEYSKKIPKLDPRVKVARSNPCFELWLVLHIEAFNRTCTSKEMEKRLEALDPQYDHNRGACPNCKALLKNLDKAEKRAEKQYKIRKRDKGRATALSPPYTTVFELTKALRGK